MEALSFRKQTAANTLLHASSHHPRSLVGGIPVGQFQRIRRNCSTESDYQREADELYKRFRERCYLHRTLKRAKNIASEKMRSDLLKPHCTTSEIPESSLRIITKFGEQWKELGKVIGDHWHILTRSSDLKDIVGPRPYLVAKRASNLNDTLVQSEFVKTPN